MLNQRGRRSRGGERPVPSVVAHGSLALLAFLLSAGPFAAAQQGQQQGQQQVPFGPGGATFGAGGPGNTERLEIVERFDLDGDGFLNAEEREAAKAYLQEIGWSGGGGFPGGGGGAGGGRAGAFATSGSTGVTITPDEVEAYAGSAFYDTSVVRTIFIETGFDDWEAEIATFFNTDVELPITATIDGVVYEDVGLRFRGNSSYSMVPEGLKRPLRIKLDTVVSGQSVEGVRTIKLLNGINDPSFVRTVIASMIMQDYTVAPRVNFVRLVVNGENWGIYPSQQHYNTDLLRDHFGESGGVRWEVPGSPNGQGGMVYLGGDPDLYSSTYEIQNRDTAASWAALIELFRVLDATPADELVAALEPILDIDGALAFLALDVVLANSDGFWTRASDYELYLAEDGRFHIFAHDLNETLGAGGFGGGAGVQFPAGFEPGAAGVPVPGDLPEGFEPGAGRQIPGGGFRGQFPGAAGGGPGGGATATLDPLVGLTDATKPLRSKLLAVPELQKRYLEIVLDIAERWLDWEILGPIAAELQALIDEDVEIDTRKLYSYEQFQVSLEGDGGLRSFVEQRREYLLATVPALLEALEGVASYQEPESTAVVAASSAAALEIANSASYALHDGPEGWHLTAGSGQVVTFAAEDLGAPVAAFTFDALGEGFGENKLDQCVAIDAAQDLAIGLQVYADASNASGLGVRINPNFHATLASCEAAMALDAGGDRLSGGRNNDDLDFVLTGVDGGSWLLFSEETLPELRYAAADIPTGATYLRLSVRARDRSGVSPAPTLYLAAVSVTQDGSGELLVNGDFALP